MAFINRTDAEALIPEIESKEIIKGITAQSTAFQLFTRLPNMSSKTTKMPVLNSLPIAYWQNADNSKKQLTKLTWERKFLVAEEIAVIVPIPENVVNDSEYDIWGEVKERLVEAFGAKVDEAMIFGIDTPSTWPKAIVPLAIERGYSVVQSGSDFFKAGNDAMEKVEESGYNVTALLGGADINAKFRNLLDLEGRPLVGTDFQNLPRFRTLNGTFDGTAHKFILGDFKQAVYSIRQDLTYTVLTEAVIQDPATGAILYNLAQDDMVALRAVLRVAYQVPNPINRLKPNEPGRYPFAVCTIAQQQVATPVISGATPFATTTSVSIASANGNATIYYTTNGDNPTTASTLYTGAFTLSATATVKAIAVYEGYTNSAIASKTFTKS
jgi:HK97 family phage major capsid protein